MWHPFCSAQSDSQNSKAATRHRHVLRRRPHGSGYVAEDDGRRQRERATVSQARISLHALRDNEAPGLGNCSSSTEPVRV